MYNKTCNYFEYAGLDKRTQYPEEIRKNWENISETLNDLNEDCLLNYRHKESFLEKIINGIEKKYNISEKYPDSLAAKVLKHAQNWALYPQLGAWLPSDAQAAYCRKAGLKENTLTKYAIAFGYALQGFKLFGGLGIISLGAGHTAPLIIGGAVITYAALVSAEISFRLAYTLITKKPWAYSVVEVPYRFGKCGFKSLISRIFRKNPAGQIQKS